MITRRNFLSLGAAGAASLLLGYKSGRAYSEGPEPKSIHTWLDSGKSQIYNYDVDFRINKFPENPPRSWLYYFSLQVNFTGHGEWSHGGIQWAGSKEFRDSGNKGINWGGGSDWAGYGGIGVTNTPFTWETGRWYRFRTWRLDKQKDGLWRWLFAVMDYGSGREFRYGTVRTKSPWIKNAVVFTETGYGVECTSDQTEVEWRSPVFRHTGGKSVPNRGTATYNGTCTPGYHSTNQGLISGNPLRWFHSTNTLRRVDNYTRLWANG
ncbi:MAG: twin-arginine translocation signal domain-containing protein [Acidobacteriota bacterium]|nr:twin-arginine translocation signal domain-containing protein [Acidobacteriota bacterium]